MSVTLPRVVARAAPNSHADPARGYGPQLRKIVNIAAAEQALAQIRRWPGYRETPLWALKGLAGACGVGSLYYKDEGLRFELGSFKALGGAYAVSRLLMREIATRSLIDDIGIEDLLSGRYRDYTRDITVTCATDGNHGRSVAWGARLFGCRCVIYVHSTVSEYRAEAIAQYGAEVVRTAGNYDQAIRQAALDADWHGRHVVSDTSYPGYLEIPRDVMQGYTVMVEEALAQWPERQPPSHVFLCAGVGSMAAAVIAHFWERLEGQRPRFVVVEPDQADCVFRSIQAGERVDVDSELDTLMAGLACGEVSVLAWEILREGMDLALSVPDQAAVDGMRLLAQGLDGDPPVVAGESAVAGLAGLLAVVQEPALRQALALDSDSRVLLFGTEGATDPALYTRLVGRSAAAVAGEPTAEGEVHD